ncbi:hypothetical protein Bbelb_359180 [Branchiostoma belcheri]|nr:hypothetical protein Bbelb_359180 [Branchiostoma belcheri]
MRVCSATLWEVAYMLTNYFFTKIVYVEAIFNEWHAICATWRSGDGAWQVYTDGVLLATGSRLNVGGKVRRGGTWILAQDQDTVTGGYAESQAFCGELSQVNLWDRVLSADEIGTNWSVFCNYHGNVIDWATTNVTVSGQASSDLYRCGKYSKLIIFDKNVI